ncbi:unnamed protein product, partial [marine sediment metagenome]
PLCEGSLDLKELLQLTDEKLTQRYIVKEIQKIYVSQGAATLFLTILALIRLPIISSPCLIWAILLKSTLIEE